MGDATVGRRRLGIDLRRLREQREMTNAQVARESGLSEATLSRIENGKRVVKPSELRVLMDLYEVTDVQQRERFAAMSRHTAEENWWDDYDDVLPSGLGSYVGLEAEADRLRSYHPSVIHALLATEDYARAVTRATLPASGGSQQHVDRLVELKVQRRQVLERRNPLRLWVVLDEAALRRPFGDAETMRAQFRHLVEMADRPNVTVQVMPLSRGHHVGLIGPFTLIEFENPDDLDHVYVESPAGNLFLQKKPLVAEFRERFSLLSASALAPEDLEAFVSGIAKDLTE
ncbi:helix-turn-helix transcriptional regulator [Nocardiopsis sp. CC223A]|uniref:helix-turn-helix domain-containing protein n=1 Tax=Nocardiopsis sp. CC223A TaxID=3044051 RepID=UPI00278BC12A|nr:helix-turn-helix transcriptional regulator [Nocardiopsis sp. CC223A]